MRRSIYARWPASLLLLSFVSFTSFVLFPLLISLSCRFISICKVAIGREKAMLMGIDNDVILIVEIVSKRDTTRRTEVSRH